MTIRQSLIDNDLTSDSYYVKSVTQHFHEMDESYKKEDYDNMVNYAKSMIESALKYSYKAMTGKEFTHKTIVLSDQATQAFNEFNLVNSNDVDLAETLKTLLKTIIKIGNVRNTTSPSHGNTNPNPHITKIQAKFVYVTSIAIANYIIDILFDKTNSFSKNVVGGKIDKSPDEIKKLEKIDQGNSTFMYKNDSNNFLTVEYFCNGPEIITSVELRFSNAIFIDRNDIEEHIRDYIESDAKFIKAISEHNLIYHSEKRSIDYKVNIYDQEKVIIVDIIGQGLEG